MPLLPAVTEAAGSRFRPVLLTTITTIAGLLPLTLNITEGGEFWVPLGVAGSRFADLDAVRLHYIDASDLDEEEGASSSSSSSSDETLIIHASHGFGSNALALAPLLRRLRLRTRCAVAVDGHDRRFCNALVAGGAKDAVAFVNRDAVFSECSQVAEACQRELRGRCCHP